MKNICVIGWPITHSRSPIIHGYWLKTYRQHGSYVRTPVQPSELKQFVGNLKSAGFSGCNVTIPHKEAVFPEVAIRDDTTKRLGAVNTIYIDNDTLVGTNTDGEGFLGNLRDQAPGFELKNKRAVLLGAGGAATAIVNALLEQGTQEIAVANRSIEKANQLRNKFGKQIVPTEWQGAAEQLSECDILVNTTSLGMNGQPPLTIDLTRLQRSAIVVDAVYVPLRTPLLIEAAARGHRVVGGLGMLLHQAVGGFELWFGVRPAVTQELYTLVARDIDPDYAA
jgi:shikimate dehydrogenase